MGSLPAIIHCLFVEVKQYYFNPSICVLQHKKVDSRTMYRSPTLLDLISALFIKSYFNFSIPILRYAIKIVIIGDKYKKNAYGV